MLNSLLDIYLVRKNSNYHRITIMIIIINMIVLQKQEFLMSTHINLHPHHHIKLSPSKITPILHQNHKYKPQSILNTQIFQHSYQNSHNALYHNIKITSIFSKLFYCHKNNPQIYVY